MEVELIREAFKSARAGWYKLLGTLALINLVLLIDLITGKQFLSDAESIKALGLEVPRIAFSLIYSVLFGVFVLWSVASTKVFSEIITSCHESIENIPEYRLWLLSPISQSKVIRIMFWLFVADGLVILALVSFIHINELIAPSTEKMSTNTYVAIGWFCILVFLITFITLLFHVLPKWRTIYVAITENTNKLNKGDAENPGPPS
ncbi:hypothetical protein L0668_19815 [Paraglaciecola aquimarina]|uniref:TRAP transporter small permease n=1 Tax=Paraglaciecola algarum TaxID=3050085 RepID=A0ABS9DFH9_9ALTE|nr:hypothetical protein [Paraglaciecola sp. G1-23]MCF2950366.1 hypothetical protein [Paraglaciecola sp. G1-23]